MADALGAPDVQNWVMRLEVDTLVDVPAVVVPVVVVVVPVPVVAQADKAMTPKRIALVLSFIIPPFYAPPATL